MAILDDLRAQLRPESLVVILAAGVLLVAMAGFLYVVKPSLAEYRKIDEKRTAAASGLAFDPNAGDAAIAAVDRQIEELRGELYGGSAGVPARQIEAFVIDGLDRIAARRSVELVSVKPGPAGDVLMFEELPYDVRVEGDYLDLYDWLQEAEEELRPMVVTEFHMRPERDSTRVSLELRLVAYRATEGAS